MNTAVSSFSSVSKEQQLTSAGTSRVQDEHPESRISGRKEKQFELRRAVSLKRSAPTNPALPRRSWSDSLLLLCALTLPGPPHILRLHSREEAVTTGHSISERRAFMSCYTILGSCRGSCATESGTQKMALSAPSEPLRHASAPESLDTKVASLDEAKASQARSCPRN